MKTIEDLKREYENYQVGDNFVDNYRSFCNYIDGIISLIGNKWEECYKQIQENDKWKKVSEFKNKFPILFTPEDIDCYERDNDILLDTGALLIGNLDYYVRIRDASSTENYVELNKLLNFLLDQYENNINFLNSRRKRLVQKIVEDTSYEDTSEVVSYFAEGALAEYEGSKQYIKI